MPSDAWVSEDAGARWSRDSGPGWHATVRQCSGVYDDVGPSFRASVHYWPADGSEIVWHSWPFPCGSLKLQESMAWCQTTEDLMRRLFAEK